MLQFTILFNCDNFPCLIFLSQNFLIPLSSEISQGAKYPNFPKLYATAKQKFRNLDITLLALHLLKNTKSSSALRKQ